MDRLNVVDQTIFLIDNVEFKSINDIHFMIIVVGALEPRMELKSHSVGGNAMGHGPRALGGRLLRERKR